jgi:hypothetical protein
MKLLGNLVALFIREQVKAIHDQLINRCGWPS